MMMYCDVCFPELGKVMSKSALATTMINGSNAAGKLIPPTFQFQMLAQMAEAEEIWIEMLCYMLDIWATFGHKEVQSFPTALGLNNKGGMDNDKFFKYLQNSIMKLYPNAAPVKGRWVIIK
jgi:hypothetical protein